MSVSAITGICYDFAVQEFFKHWSDGIEITLDQMISVGISKAEELPATSFKTGAKTPTVDAVLQEVSKKIAFTCRSFQEEKATYLDNIKKVLYIDELFECNVSLNGVNIPLPLHFRPDLVYENHQGELCVLDHKAVYKYTDKHEFTYKYGMQAITYMIGLEAVLDRVVSEFHFFENKTTQNKTGANKDRAQIQRIPVPVDQENRRLYELMLYEGVKDVLTSAQDPDKVYLYNPHDQFLGPEEKGELIDFWISWQTQEVETINPELSDERKKLLSKRRRKIADANLSNINPEVIKKFKREASSFINYMDMTDLSNKEKIETRLRTLGLPVNVEHVIEGHSCETYLATLSYGRKISDIFKYKLDIANALDQESVRIGETLTRYKGKSFVRIEVNKDATKRTPIKVTREHCEHVGKMPLGIDNFGNVIYWDLNNQSTPHMLVCGATGSGKSVLLLTILNAAIQQGIENIFILDPKFEFSEFAARNISVINEVNLIEIAMSGLVEAMNERIRSGEDNGKILVIFDEFADAISNSKKGRELNIYGPDGKIIARKKSLEENFRLLLQKSRSAGFRVVAATQRASAKVINGDTKVNMPIQVCFRVPKDVDSKVVIDEPGAASLGGLGDGLIRSPEYSETVRFQGFLNNNQL
jgi:energy-coupling factor transporter ATP-binding protein EcfA2